jgi:hypothetical protein
MKKDIVIESIKRNIEHLQSKLDDSDNFEKNFPEESKDSIVYEKLKMSDAYYTTVEDMIEFQQGILQKLGNARERERDLIKFAIMNIQTGNWDRNVPECPKGNIAQLLWEDQNFSYGMEYGAIVALMQSADLTIAELDSECPDDTVFTDYLR